MTLRLWFLSLYYIYIVRHIVALHIPKVEAITRKSLFCKKPYLWLFKKLKKTSRKMDPKNSSTPPLCAKGCGFFGFPENKNFCSKCYNDYFIEELIAEPSKKLSELIVTPSADDNSTDVFAEETTSATTSAVASTPTVKNRCKWCHKKVGLMGFNCRCGKTFCGAHRYPKDHSCTFDFKTLDQQHLTKQNPLAAGDKLGSRI